MRAAAFLLATLCLYLMFSPVWVPRLAPSAYDNARSLQLGLLALFSLSLVIPSWAANVTSAWMSLGLLPRVLIAVLLGGGALSAAVSAVPQLGALEVALVAQLVVLFLGVCVLVRWLPRTEEALAVAICAGAALVVLQFWLTLGLYLLEGKAFSWIHPFLEFANVRFFSQYQAYTLVLMALPLALYRLQGWRRALVYFFAAAFWSMQWLVAARSVWVGFAVAACLVLVFARGQRQKWLLQQGAVVLAGGAICLLLVQFILSVPDANPMPRAISLLDRGPQSAHFRLLLAGSALSMVAEHPWLGIGPGQFGLFYSLSRAAHPHNTPLQLLAEYGLVAGTAGVLLGIALAVFAMRSLATSARASDLAGVGIAAALLMGLVESLFSGNLTMPHGQVFFCVVAGWLVGRRPLHASAGDGDRNHARTIRIGLAAVALLAAGVTLVLSIEYLSLVREMPRTQQDWIPHFWQYGRFSAW
jgi:putative inorganic carbon (hco3(-)) transporter